jgi:hypothetical protein
MDESASTANATNPVLPAALLDFSRSPGKYQVGFRQPELLFTGLREVLQIAVGRAGQATPARTAESAELRDAARFFVRTALLYPGADHYALLGVDRKVVNADLKDRYRLMMRLLHPDFSGPGAGNWPADAAVRVNRAYDTLSSAVQRRLYDESLNPMPGPTAISGPDLRRPRPPIHRLDDDGRQSHFKTLAAVCALAGVALIAVILLGTGSSESVHLVQRARVQSEAVQIASQEPSRSAPASPVARLQELMAQALPGPAAPPAKPIGAPGIRAAVVSPEPKRPATFAAAAPQQIARPTPPPLAPAQVQEARLERVAEPGRIALVASPPRAEPRPELVVVATAPTPPPPPPTPAAPVVVSAVQAAPAPRPAPKPGPTLVEAQPLLSQLLQVMESGRGERILNMLDAEARSKPAAQALSRQYDTLVDGARPVRVSHVELKAEPSDGRLLVVGYFRVLAGEQAIGALGKKMVLRAEFASREGTVVITGLSGGPVN